MLDIVRAVIEHEIGRKQEAWEMLVDGYAGDIEAYIADYADDYDVEQVTPYTYKVMNQVGHSWIVEDGDVERIIF